MKIVEGVGKNVKFWAVRGGGPAEGGGSGGEVARLRPIQQLAEVEQMALRVSSRTGVTKLEAAARAVNPRASHEDRLEDQASFWAPSGAARANSYNRTIRPELARRADLAVFLQLVENWT